MRNVYIFSAIAILFLGGYGWLHWRSGNVNAASQQPPRRILYWVDPMHPSYKSDKPGIAPDCGMKLEPVYEDDHKTAEPAPGRTIHVSPEMQRMVGVRFGEVSSGATSETIRAPGRVVPDETRITRVYPHMEGWVSRIFVDFNGQSVKKGDLLVTVYSPEVVAAEQELLLALRVRDQMQASPVKEAWGNSELLVQAARRRLEVFDLTPAQIGEIEQTRSPLEGGTVQELFSTRGGSSDSHASGTVQTVAIYSPATGFVTARNAYPSQHVTTETELYALTDLSHVWIMADVFENDIAGIHVGQSAAVSPPDGPAFTARVSYVQPQVDPQTRTAKVRLEADNENLRLKPDMFVGVQFPMGSKRALMVPADAVMDTGTAQTVYVDRGEGNLEPRAVHIGRRVGDQVEILAGLHAGERIVTSGTFLIDSESRMRSGASPMPSHPESH